MAFKLRAPYHDSLYVLIILLLLHLSSTSAQVSPTVLQAQSEILQVLVPNTTSFREFVDCSDGPTAVAGFCIDVFKYALSILIPKPNWTNINYTCYDFGSSGTYDSMINELNKSSSMFDAVVGDTTISAARLRNASFTQPYLDSGIVLLTPAESAYQQIATVFLAPFTLWAWILIAASILVTGASVLIIEYNERQRDKTESSEHALVVIRFFTSVPLFFRQNSHKSPRSKIVMIAWTVFILLVGSSYTASMSSILTVDKLSSDIKSIDDLKSKGLSIGILEVSIVKDYLQERQNITKLEFLSSEDDYTNALRSRQVAAIAEESPYVSLLLADQPASDCKFLVSPKLTNEGFGFAFRDERLASAFSVAILNLSESGQLRRLQDGWKLADFRCSSQIQSTPLDPKSALGLFILLGIVILICLMLLGLEKLWFCFRARAHARQRQNQGRDAVHAFREQGGHESMRRRVSFGRL